MTTPAEAARSARAAHDAVIHGIDLRIAGLQERLHEARRTHNHIRAEITQDRIDRLLDERLAHQKGTP